jgi:hypothetical protein
MSFKITRFNPIRHIEIMMALEASFSEELGLALVFGLRAWAAGLRGGLFGWHAEFCGWRSPRGEVEVEVEIEDEIEVEIEEMM